MHAEDMESYLNQAGITTLAVPTCNRVDGLQRCLESYLRNFEQFGRTCELVIVDDSPTAEVRRQCRRMLLNLSKKFAIPIIYAGLEEKALYCRLLMQAASVPPDCVKFALFDSGHYKLGTYGANRNAILLHTTGQMVVMVDDDTICRAVAPPINRPNFSLFPSTSYSSSFPCRVWVYPDHNNLLSGFECVDKDFIGLHETMLGLPISHSVSLWKQNIDGTEAPADELEGDTRQVIATFNGLAGDCAWPSPSNYLLLDDESLRALLRSNESYTSACLSRQVLRVTTEFGVSEESANSPGLFAGLDNRQMLPPYFPIGRGEDIIYWNILACTRPKCVFGFIPWAFLHCPTESRQFWPGETLRSSSGIALDIMVSHLIKCFKRETGGLDSDVGALGRYLSELGRLHLSAFSDVVNESLKTEARLFIAHLENIAATHPDGPPKWQYDIRRFIGNVQQSLFESNGLVPLDLLYGRTEAIALELTHRLISQFGALLTHWPAITRAAAQLKTRGQTLGQLISDV